MKKKLSLILALMLALTLVLGGCGNDLMSEDGEYRYVSEMSAEKEALAKKTITDFMSCYEENRAADSLSLFVEGFDATPEDLQNFFDGLRNIAEKPFVPYDAYYTDDLEISEVTIKVKKNAEAQDYIEITPAHEEMYTALYASEGENISYMLSLVLVEEDDEFKIAFINPGFFKYKGKDAKALYEDILTMYKNDELVSAYIASCMLANTFRPGGYYRYVNDVEMEDLCYKLYTEVSDKFEIPLALENTSNSVVYEMNIINENEYGAIPLIRIKTDAVTDDEAALSAEAELVINALETLSPGIRKNFDYARIEATNEDMESTSSPEKVEKITVKLK